jgi:hypothetical protein
MATLLERIENCFYVSGPILADDESWTLDQGVIKEQEVIRENAFEDADYLEMAFEISTGQTICIGGWSALPAGYPDAGGAEGQMMNFSIE